MDGKAARMHVQNSLIVANMTMHNVQLSQMSGCLDPDLTRIAFAAVS